MSKFYETIFNKQRGEHAVASLSEKAYKYYSTTDPLTVYEYTIDVEDGIDCFGDPILVEEKRYAVKECGEITFEDLTFEELEQKFVDCQEYCEMLDHEEEEEEE